MFTTELFTDIALLSAAVKERIIQRLGTRTINNKPCLGTTVEDVRRGIEDGIYTAFIFIRNQEVDDEASAALQYADLCDDGVNRLWMHDLCRITRAQPKPKMSPVRPLIQACCRYAESIGLKHLHILVDKHSGCLQTLYTAYGFVTDETCCIDDYIVMHYNASCKTKRG